MDGRNGGGDGASACGGDGAELRLGVPGACCGGMHVVLARPPPESYRAGSGARFRLATGFAFARVAACHSALPRSALSGFQWADYVSTSALLPFPRGCPAPVTHSGQPASLAILLGCYQVALLPTPLLVQLCCPGVSSRACEEKTTSCMHVPWVLAVADTFSHLLRLPDFPSHWDR